MVIAEREGISFSCQYVCFQGMCRFSFQSEVSGKCFSLDLFYLNFLSKPYNALQKGKIPSNQTDVICKVHLMVYLQLRKSWESGVYTLRLLQDPLSSKVGVFVWVSSLGDIDQFKNYSYWIWLRAIGNALETTQKINSNVKRKWFPNLFAQKKPRQFNLQ